MINIIAVIGKNRAIGKDNKLLWNIPEDMARFKKLTAGHTVIMGRKTFESIGQPLPNRRNIVITRDKNYKAESCEIYHSLEEALKTVKQVPSPLEGEACPPNWRGQGEVFIIGGGEIYKQALSFCDKLYLTVVDDKPQADTFFPDWEKFGKIVKEEARESDDLKYTFLEIVR